jgi:hypothetical protein
MNAANHRTVSALYRQLSDKLQRPKRVEGVVYTKTKAGGNGNG